MQSGVRSPAATMSELDAASRHGVLAKGSLGAVAKLAWLTNVAFDKTRTLTRIGLDQTQARPTEKTRY
jgi:cation transport ATPase